MSRVDFNALVCDNLEEDGKFLAVDYRIDCDSPAWKSTIQIIGWVGVSMWPIGFPLLLLFMLHSYSVPALAKRKTTDAAWRAYIEHTLSQFIDRGLPLSGMRFDTQVVDLTDNNLRSILRLVHETPVPNETPAPPQVEQSVHRPGRRSFGVKDQHCTDANTSPSVAKRAQQTGLDQSEGFDQTSQVSQGPSQQKGVASIAQAPAPSSDQQGSEIADRTQVPQLQQQVSLVAPEQAQGAIEISMYQLLTSLMP